MPSAQASSIVVVDPAQAWSSTINSFAQAMLTYAAQAFDALPEHRTCHLPTKTVHCGFSDPRFASICDRAFAFAERPADHVRTARIAILDLSTCPKLPAWQGPPPGMGNVTIPLAKEGICAVVDPDYRSWHFYDAMRGIGVLALETTDRRPSWDDSFPIRLLLNWASRSDRSGLVHAGTLGLRGQGVLLVGAGGQGKSGTTLSGIMHGLQSAGDDYVSVQWSDNGVTAMPVLRRMKQDLGGLNRHGIESNRAGILGLNWQGKYEFDFASLVPGARTERLEISAVLLPRIAHASETSFHPASMREAMMRLAPSTLYQLYGSWKDDFNLVANLARALPAYYVDLSDRPAEIASAITRFIEKERP